MDIIVYHRSLQKELDALKNRIRNLMSNPHWLTDGEWKESVLRSVIRRHLPESFQIGHGFIITSGKCSKQIDILVYDKSYPLLFRDGDLVFVTPDAVRGIISVKSKISKSKLGKTLNDLTQNLKIVIEHVRKNHNVDYFGRWKYFFGLFAYEDEDLDHKKILELLQKKAAGDPFKAINHLTIGKSSFFKYWEGRRIEEGKWRSYRLEDLAAAYFVSNLIYSLSPRSVMFNAETWFPPGSKEIDQTGEISLRV